MNIVTFMFLLSYINFELFSFKVYVFDDAIPTTVLLANEFYLNFNDHWRYVEQNNRNASELPLFDDHNGIPWKSWQDPTLYSSSRLGHVVRELIELTRKNNRGNIERYNYKNCKYSAF